MKHTLKTDPKVFEESWQGRKKFEIRFGDRDFEVGDTLILNETRFSGQEMSEGKPLELTGRSITQRVDYILDGGVYGLELGWVIMSVTNLT